MGPSTRVLRNAIVAAVVLLLSGGVTRSTAQPLDVALRSLDFSPDPIARSPRLLGMGRLTLADDLHNRITLWDFAGNPTGIADAESLTTLELRPVFRSSTVMRDIPFGGGVGERQELGAGQMRHSLETWRRAPGATAYGLTAEFVTLQVDRPFSDAVERRSRFSVPAIGGAVNGRMPWLKSDRFDFALRLGYGLETFDETYFEFLRLPQGEYLGRRTASVPSSDFYQPDHVETSSLQAGVGFAMQVSTGIKAAVNYDRARLKVRSKLDGLRSTSKVEEDRPFDIGQASLIGRFGRSIEWGADGRAWRSQSEEFFFWTVSAGPTQAPLSGTGKRLDREEKGTALRARARWMSGSLELGAGIGTAFRRSVVNPWFPTRAGDAPGFNDFLSVVGARVGADTLLLPARILSSQIDERSLQVSAGASWRMPGDRGLIGAEFHRRRRLSEQALIGSGPEPKGWDIRAGGEYRCNDALMVRAGWNYGVSDRDDLTADNAYRGATATAGFGYRPVGARWSADLGYAYEWVRADFVDPTRSRGANQQMAAQLRWPF